MAAVGLAVFGIILARFPPDTYPIYPSCPFQEYLGWQCPGCGLTRALAELLSGRIREAAAHNLVAVALVPFSAALAIRQSYSVLRWNRWRPMQFAQRGIGFVCAAFLIFGLSRNLNDLFSTLR